MSLITATAWPLRTERPYNVPYTLGGETVEVAAASGPPIAAACSASSAQRERSRRLPHLQSAAAAAISIGSLSVSGMEARYVIETTGCRQQPRPSRRRGVRHVYGRSVRKGHAVAVMSDMIDDKAFSHGARDEEFGIAVATLDR